MDLQINDFLMEEFLKKHKIDISKDNVARQRILDTRSPSLPPLFHINSYILL